MRFYKSRYTYINDSKPLLTANLPKVVNLGLLPFLLGVYLLIVSLDWKWGDNWD